MLDNVARPQVTISLDT